MFRHNQLRHSIIYRFIVINLLAVAILSLTVYQGWAIWVFTNDTTHITAAIAVLFLAGLVISFQKVWRLNYANTMLITLHERDALRVLRLTRVTYNSLILRATANISIINRLAVTMLLFGICGTVVGLMIALSQVDPAVAKDVSLVGPMAATLLHGVSIKLSTTLVGIIGNIWTSANYQLLSSESQKIVASICEAKGV